MREQALDAIRQHAARGGLSTSEQEAVVNEAVDSQGRMAREHIARTGVDCQHLDATLQMYSSLLKR